MKNLHLLGAAALLVGALAGCNDEVIESVRVDDNALKVSAESMEPSSRVGFSVPGGNFFWSERDVLTVTLNQKDTKAFSNYSMFGIIDGAGTDKGIFSGSKLSTEEIGNYAAYPVSVARFTEDALYVKIPEYIYYDHVDQSLPSGDALTRFNSFNTLMAGKITNGHVNLQHLGGVLCIEVENMPTESGYLSLQLNNNVLDEFKVPVSDIGTDKGILVTSALPEYNYQPLNISYKNAKVGQNGLFYFPMPTGEYNGFKLTIPTANGTREHICSTPFTIHRRGFVKFDVKTVDSGNTVDEFLNALNDPEQASFKLTGPIDLSGLYFNIPKGKDFTIDLNGNTLTIRQTLQVENTLTVIDTNTAAQEPGKIVGKPGSDVIHTTPTGTFIMNGGSLPISDGQYSPFHNEGNIVINGGTFNHLHALTYLGKDANCKNVTVNMINPDPTQPVDYYVEPFTIAKEAVNANVVINLNNSELSFNVENRQTLEVGAGSLTIKNGKLGRYEESQSHFIDNRASLTLEGVTVHNYTNGAAIVVNDKDAVLTMKDCIVEAYRQAVWVHGGTANMSQCNLNMILQQDTSVDETQSWNDLMNIPLAPLVMGNREEGASAFANVGAVVSLTTNCALNCFTNGHVSNAHTVYAWANQGEMAVGVQFNFDKTTTFNIPKRASFATKNIFVNGKEKVDLSAGGEGMDMPQVNAQ